MKSKILLAACICCSLWAQAKNNYADYVSTLRSLALTPISNYQRVIPIPPRPCLGA